MSPRAPHGIRALTRNNASPTTDAIVPVKVLGSAKQRLDTALSPEQRRTLVLDMLGHVLDQLEAAASIRSVLICSSDSEVGALARQRGMEVLVDPEASSFLDAGPDNRAGAEHGLNRALAVALEQLASRGSDAALILHADLPNVTAEEIDRLCAASSATVAMVTDSVTTPDQAPASVAIGTNALLLSPLSVLPPSFGRDSARRHIDLARTAGIEPVLLDLPGMRVDIDTPDDLSTTPDKRGSRMSANLRSSSLPLESRLSRALSSGRLDAEEALAFARQSEGTISDDDETLNALMSAAAEMRDQGHGSVVTYSRKVFLPLTHLCRDICHYCIFAQPPKKGEAAYMTREQVLTQARRASEAGCKEALFTLGDKPEARYKAARDGLAQLGHETTLSYLREVAESVFVETGLLPHLNPGLMTAADFEQLRPVSASMGIMLESVSDRLMQKGQAHYGCPDKLPHRRLETLRLAGEARVPFTSGILIGIGETREERIEALLALRDLQDRYGHIQEIIVQNFRAKEGTRMADAPEPDLNELLHTLALTRLIFGAEMNVQAPPNLSPGVLPQLVGAGINDWGGVSPVTPDFVNPEAPWPHLDRLAEETARAGKVLTERLTIYPDWAIDGETWLDPKMRTAVLQAMDTQGLARTSIWSPGDTTPPPSIEVRTGTASAGVRRILDRARQGNDLSEGQIETLFAARGEDFAAVCKAADDLRRQTNGETVTYVVNRNINYTNICYFKCQFCAFSKGKMSENLRGKPYDLGLDEIARRVEEAWQRGATEVCMQGGIHPSYTGDTYVEICRAVKNAQPDMHIHAFSPLEVWQGASTSGLSLREFLTRLRDAGLGTLPGTAAEILDDEVREILCADKIRTDQWLEVMRTAHQLGIRTTATIMYGHVERPVHWARHLLRLRALQKETGGFTEFVPLPFVPMEAPIFLKGRARRGPTYREAILMHAVARLALFPHFENIQASWVKMGPTGVAACLNAGVNDLGGTLMNESITRAAGAAHGEELPPSAMEGLIRECGRTPQQRTTLYGSVSPERIETSFEAAPLLPPIQTPAHRYERTAPVDLIRPGLD